MKLSWWTLWVTHMSNLSNWKFSHLSQTLSSFPYRSIPDGKFPYQWSLFNFQCIRKASLFILDHIPGNVISCKILITNNRDNFLMENITLGCIDYCSEIYLWSQVFHANQKFFCFLKNLKFTILQKRVWLSRHGQGTRIKHGQCIKVMKIDFLVVELLLSEFAKSSFNPQVARSSFIGITQLLWVLFYRMR